MKGKYSSTFFMVSFVILTVFFISCGGGDSGDSSSDPETGIVSGQVTYSGSIGTVDSTHKMTVALYDESNTQMQGEPDYYTYATENPVIYNFEVALGSYQLFVAFDSNADGVWDGDNTTPYEIYNDISTFDDSSLKIRVLTDGDAKTVNIEFDDTFLK